MSPYIYSITCASLSMGHAIYIFHEAQRCKAPEGERSKKHVTQIVFQMLGKVSKMSMSKGAKFHCI